MYITIISLCKYKILEEEFVKPLVNIFKKYGKINVIHYKNLDDEPFGNMIVLSGTALKDFEYLNYLKKFEWIKESKKVVIGICAGAQIIALIFGCKLKNKEYIGVYNVESVFGKFRAYFLTTKIPVLNKNFEILGKIDNDPAIFKVKNKEIYGFVFHPEVLNKDLFEKILF